MKSCSGLVLVSLVTLGVASCGGTDGNGADRSEQYTPDQANWETFASKPFAGDTNTAHDPDGVGWISPEDWAAAEWDGIEYRGYIDGDTKRELIDSCRAMVGPSVWWEPLGLITYKAYDAGKPILHSLSQSPRTRRQHGLAGIIRFIGDQAEGLPPHGRPNHRPATIDQLPFGITIDIPAVLDAFPLGRGSFHFLLHRPGPTDHEARPALSQFVAGEIILFGEGVRRFALHQRGDFLADHGDARGGGHGEDRQAVAGARAVG